MIEFLRWSFAILAVAFAAFPTIKYFFLYSIFFSKRDLNMINNEIVCGFGLSLIALLIICFTYY